MTARQERFELVFQALGQERRGFFTRGVPLEFQATVLDAFSSLGGGRYNAAGTFEMYYLGDNADTVARETRMVMPDAYGKVIAARHAPKIVMTVNYELQRLVDLNDPEVLDLLRIRASSLIADWKAIVLTGRRPLTQQLGAAAHAAGVEGLIVPSARNPDGINIDVIKDNMLVGSYIEVHDPKGFAPGVITRIDGKKPLP